MALKLPTAKKQLRAFKLHHFSKVVSTAVAGVQGAGSAAEGGDDSLAGRISHLYSLANGMAESGSSERPVGCRGAKHHADPRTPDVMRARLGEGTDFRQFDTQHMATARCTGVAVARSQVG